MVDLTPAATLALGFALGAGHALEPDHVAAVGTLVSEQRRVTASCLLGACWGLGHTAALLAAGVAVLVFRVAMPPGMERGLDMSVALLPIGLGLRGLLRLAAGVSLHRHRHAHGGRPHSHYHVHLRHVHLRHLHLPDLHFRSDAHDGVEHVHLAAVGGRPALVGMVAFEGARRTADLTPHSIRPVQPRHRPPRPRPPRRGPRRRRRRTCPRCSPPWW